MFDVEWTSFARDVVQDYAQAIDSLNQLEEKSTKEKDELLSKAKSKSRIEKINNAYQEKLEFIQKSKESNLNYATEKLNDIFSKIEYDEKSLIKKEEEITTADFPEVQFQSANTAGAETSAEISDAQKEYEEKGTDSKYLKNGLMMHQ